jgi:glycosyltransferase involved in cell wall biosynthesis
VCPKGFVYRNNKICELCVNRIFALPAIRYNCYHDSKLASLSLSTSLTYYKLAHDFELVDKYICPAQFVKDYYLQHLSLSEDKMKIIPHFTNVEAVKHMKSNSSYFVFVGRLSEEKGILQLLEQFVLLPNIPLIVIGDGPLRDDVQKYKTYSNITILPFISQKKLFKIMSHALATIIPSPWYEVGPLVLMESFANGTPVIVPNSGVFKERVTRNKTGFFFDLRDFTSIQKVIKSIFKKKNQVAVMRNAVQKEYHDKYSGEAYYRSLLPLYLDLTSANKSH